MYRGVIVYLEKLKKIVKYDIISKEEAFKKLVIKLKFGAKMVLKSYKKHRKQKENINRKNINQEK